MRLIAVKIPKIPQKNVTLYTSNCYYYFYKPKFWTGGQWKWTSGHWNFGFYKNYWINYGASGFENGFENGC